MPILRFGSSGEAVATVQEILRISQHYGGKIDGEFSTLTEKAVRAFQKNFGIEADGIVNQQTWTALSQIPRGYDPKWFLTSGHSRGKLFDRVWGEWGECATIEGAPQAPEALLFFLFFFWDWCFLIVFSNFGGNYQ